MSAHPIKAAFDGGNGAKLAARIDLPTGPVKAFALFAHCFTCTKDIAAARVIASALTKSGIGVMRFDFTGLGHSGGDFASSNFSMNLGDLRRAADYLGEHYEAPSLLIGHSLGGAAVIAAAASMSSVKAVATINAPADVHHITGHFAEKLPEIRAEGVAQVQLGQRDFCIQKQFIDDLERHDIKQSVKTLDKALLILHAPTDETVGIENASELFLAARHPKSYVSLDTADHLLSKPRDAAYAASVIAAWAERYLDLPASNEPEAETEDAVCVTETAQGKYQVLIRSGEHAIIGDEPKEVGGLGSGPSPYDLLSAALGACTVMTLRMYADHKNIPLAKASCSVRHEKTHAKQVTEMEEGEMKPDIFTRTLTLEGDMDDTVRQRLYEIADKCPVHKTLHRGATVLTERESP